MTAVAAPPTLLLHGAPVPVDDGLLIGEGGEARVYRHPHDATLALKVFFEPTGTPAERRQSARLADLRSKKLARFPAGLPALVVAPRAPLLDGRGQVRGYAMRRIDGAQTVSALCSPRRALDHTAASALVRALAEALPLLHARGVVVGDLNDGNVLVDGQGQPHLIDADSFQLGMLPCPVAHERFLDPRLYGRALMEGPCFDAGSDAYALRVQLFLLLTLVHPYGGVLPALPTLLRRAEARHSVLRGDVKLPLCARPLGALPDDLLHDLFECFEGGARTPLAPALLRVSWRRCTCGLEHARRACPACLVRVPAPAVRTRGGVVAERLWGGAGRVLGARDEGGRLAWLVHDGAEVRREDGSVVARGPLPAGTRFFLAGASTWVATPQGDGAELSRRVGGAEVERTHGALAFGGPVAAAGRGGLYLVRDDVLWHHERGRYLGRVLRGRTVLFAADDGGIGLYRVGRALFGVRFDERGVRDVPWPADLVRGPLVEAHASFGADGRALLGLAFDEGGRRLHALALLGADGHVLAHACGAPDEAPMFATLRGFALAHGRVLAPTPEGAMALEVDGKRLVAGAAFPDTREWVDETVELLPGSGGSLVVVQPQALVRIRLAGS